jgi:hypothetical protein
MSKTRNRKPASRPKPSRTGLLATTPKKLTLQPDPKAKRQWQRALAKLEAARSEGAETFDDFWETVLEIDEANPPLWQAGGFTTRAQFLAAHVKESERTALRFMRVAKFASPQEESRYGISKLDAALAWLEAKSNKPLGRLPIDFPRLRVPTEGRTIPFAEATVKDLQAATRQLLRTRRKTTTRRPPIVRALAAALGNRHPKVTISLTAGRLTLGNIDPETLPALLKALSRARLP